MRIEFLPRGVVAVNDEWFVHLIPRAALFKHKPPYRARTWRPWHWSFDPFDGCRMWGLWPLLLVIHNPEYIHAPA